LSRQAGADFLAAVGALYLALELLDFFKIVQRESLPPSTFFLVLDTAVVWVLLTRRPVSRIAYKIPKKDFCYEIRIADLLDSKEDIVVSTNTTFDTDISDGLISPKLKAFKVRSCCAILTEKLTSWTSRSANPWGRSISMKR
jgi:hypothetical protein